MSDNAPPTQARFSWPIALTVIVVMFMLTAAFLFVYVTKQAQSGAVAIVDAGRQGIAAMTELARAFRSGEVTTSFSSFTTQIEGSSRFQFATVQQLELFERSDQATAFWGQLELPRVVVEARAPVEYSYYLDLNGPWNFVLEDKTLTVKAPPIEFNKPAFNPSEIVYRVPEDSMWRDEEPVLEALRLGLGEMANDRARDNIKLVRELGRQRTQEFVERWLLAKFGAESGDVKVEVFFADEELPVITPSALVASTGAPVTAPEDE